MLEIFFSVKVDALPNQEVKVVGSPIELGSWNAEKGLPLIKKKKRWEGGPIEIQQERKFEFKFVKIKNNKEIEWQALPNNCNRRYRPRHSIKLECEWSKIEGNAKLVDASTGDQIDQNTFRCIESIPSPTKKKFNPYEDAKDEVSSSEDEEEEQFSWERQSLDKELFSNGQQFQQIYYRSNAFEVFCGLTRKIKIFIVSKEINLQNSFHYSVMSSLKTLPKSYHVRWITTENLSGRRKSVVVSQIPTVATFFELQDEQIHIKSLQSKTSFFILLDLESAVLFSNKIKDKGFGLFLPAAKYEDFLKISESFSQLLQWVCFDQQTCNFAFFQHISTNPLNCICTDLLKNLYMRAPKLQHIIEVIAPFEGTEEILVTPASILSESQAFPLFTEQNSITILEGDLVDHYNEFVEQLIASKKQRSAIVIICKGNHLHHFVAGLKKVNNLVIVYDNFRNIIVDAQEYQPLRRCQEIIDVFRMQIQLHCSNYGGEIVERTSSISYYLPPDKLEAAQKVYEGFKPLADKYSFLKVKRKGRKVRVYWHLAEEARTLRTICEVKYANFGLLGNFNIISDCLSLRELKQDLKLITEHYPQMFAKEDRTEIRYYSYGGRKRAPTCHVQPSCSSQ